MKFIYTMTKSFKLINNINQHLIKALLKYTILSQKFFYMQLKVDLFYVSLL